MVICICNFYSSPPKQKRWADHMTMVHGTKNNQQLQGSDQYDLGIQETTYVTVICLHLVIVFRTNHLTNPKTSPKLSSYWHFRKHLGWIFDQATGKMLLGALTSSLNRSRNKPYLPTQTTQRFKQKVIRSCVWKRASLKPKIWWWFICKYIYIYIYCPQRV